MGSDPILLGWEIAIKTALGRLKPRRTVSAAAADSGFEELPILLRHAEWIANLTPIHRDPFDRMLVAQALCDGLVLVVTRDVVFRRYGVKVIAA